MKNRTLIFILLAAVTLFTACSEENPMLPDPIEEQEEAYFKGAKKPMPELIGEQECMLDFSTFMFVCTIDFGDLGEYAITYISHGPPRDYSQANVFEEDFFIHYLDTEFSQPENQVMVGKVRGTHTLANQIPEPTKYITNGKVHKAYGPFEDWEGCNIHTSGTCYWTPEGIPITIENKWRIN
jgi:hypothetical protein